MKFHSVSSIQSTNTNLLRSSLSLPGTGFTRKIKKEPRHAGLIDLLGWWEETKYNILNIPSTSQVFLVDLEVCNPARNHCSSFMFVLNLSGQRPKCNCVEKRETDSERETESVHESEVRWQRALKPPQIMTSADSNISPDALGSLMIKCSVSGEYACVCAWTSAALR